MGNVLIDLETEECLEAHIVHVGEQAIPFEHFLDMVSSCFIEHGVKLLHRTCQ